MRTLATWFAFLALSTSAATAAPCVDTDVACLTTKLHAARAHRASSKAHTALAKAQQRAWIADCLAEHVTAPVPMAAGEAREICTAEAPTLDELRTDPTAAPIRSLRAGLQACAQRVTDDCVAHAEPDGSTDCDVDRGLKSAFERVCRSR